MEGTSYLDGLAEAQVQETFGQRMKRKRIEQQVGAAQLAKAVGISLELVQQLESDGPLVEFETLKRIGAYLQLGEGSVAGLVGASFDALQTPEAERVKFLAEPPKAPKTSVAELKERNSKKPSSEQPALDAPKTRSPAKS